MGITCWRGRSGQGLRSQIGGGNRGLSGVDKSVADDVGSGEQVGERTSESIGVVCCSEFNVVSPRSSTRT